MSNENAPIPGKKAKRPRSAAYPAINLEEAIRHSGTLCSTYPKAPFNRESAAKVIGYGTLSGIAAAKVAALVHFGLVDRKGNAYKNSDLSERIHSPLNDLERKEAVVEAVMSPKLFSALIGEYEGRAIPPALNNVLARNHGINSKVADKVVQTFKDSTEYAGVYENGVFTSGEVSEKTGKDVVEKSAQEVSELEGSKPAEVERSRRMIDVPLSSGVVVSYPSDIGLQLHASAEFGNELVALAEVVKKAFDKQNK